MRLRIHEIETGTADMQAGTIFLSNLLKRSPTVANEGLSVFSSGIAGLDLNISTHLPPGVTRISLLTDDLQEMMDRLREMNIQFEGPYESHLGMLAVSFTGVEQLQWIIHTPTEGAPDWMKP